MRDPQANSLVISYLKYMWVLYSLIAGLFIAGYTCELEGEKILLLVGAAAVVFHGGSYVYKRISQNRESFHVLTKTSLNRNSEFSEVLMCVASDFLLLLVLLGFFLHHLSASCDFVDIFV